MSRRLEVLGNCELPTKPNKHNKSSFTASGQDKMSSIKLGWWHWNRAKFQAWL